MKFLNKKLPTIIGLLILILGLGAGLVLVKNQQLFGSKAGPDNLQPQNIKISNISTNSFTVSFTTKENTPAYILAGPNQKLELSTSNYFLDNRDKLSGSIEPYQTHYITVANGQSNRQANFELQPGQKYFFKIGLGDITGIKKLYDNSGQAFEISTASNPINKAADVISGQIVDKSGKKSNGSLVYLSIPGAAPLSDQTKEGRFVIPINTAYSLDLSQAAGFDPQATLIEIYIQDAALSSSIKSVTGNKNLPEIVLGQNYDLTQLPDDNQTVNHNPENTQTTDNTPEIILSPTPESSPSGTGGSKNFSAFSNIPGLSDLNSPTNIPLTISNPAKENETIYTSKPEFRGTGPAGKLINLKIESDSIISAKINIDELGKRSYSPTQALAEGSHSITVFYILDNGDEESVSKDFTIAGSNSGDLPSYTSTPSATLTSTPTPSPRATATPTTTIRSTMPSTESGVPSSGVTTPTILISLMALFFFIGSFIFAKKID